MNHKNHEKIWEAISDIRENHLTHLEKDLARTTTNVDWLTRFFWIVATSSIGALITGIANLV